MKRHLSVLVMLLLLSSLMAVALQQNKDVNRKHYATDRIKIKLSSEAVSRANLPAELYAEKSYTGINELDQLMSQTGATKIIKAHREVKDTNWEKQTGFDRWFILKLNGKITVEEAIKEFQANRYIEEAIPEYIAYPAVVPNDTYYANNWGHNNTAQLPAYTASGHTGAGVGTIGFDSDAQLAWNQSQSYGSANIIIAIIDTGVDTSHPDLRLVTGYDFGDNDSNPMDDSADPGHGTACSGIATAKANNSLGITGIAGGCSVMPLKVADSNGDMYFTAIENALTYAADHNADIASMSLGATDVAEGDSPSTDAALNYAYNSGVVLFAATGNEDNPTISYPANETSVISVGAASPTGQRKSASSSDGEYWWGSNYGANSQNNKNAVDIMAPTILPATDLTGTGNGYNTSGDYYLWFNGTSCATPYAAGVAALLLSKDPSLTPAQVFSKLTSTATDMTIDGGAGWDRYTGYGMVNANAALNTILDGMPSCTITAPVNNASYPLNSNITINANATDSNGSIVSVKFYINNTLRNTDYSSPYSWEWNTTGFPTGSFVIKALATDNSNNETYDEITVALISPVTEAIIGNGTSVTGNQLASPINVYYKSLHGQSVYTAAELNQAGIFGPANITQLGFNIAGLPAVTMPNFIVRLKHTTANNVSTFVNADSLVTVYSNPNYLPTQTGWNMYNFSTPFLWNGIDNLLVDTAFGISSSWNASGTVQYTSRENGYHFSRNDYSDQTNVFSGGDASSYRPNIKLIVEQADNGPQISVAPASLDFSSIPIGQSSSQQFTIQNYGNAALIGTITTPEGFTVSEATRSNNLNTDNQALVRNTISFNIPAGITYTYLLSFIPLTVGSFSGNVIISSNADNDPLVNLQITASAYIPPTIDVSSNELAVTLYTETATNENFTISNLGSLPLTYDISIRESRIFSQKIDNPDKSIEGSTLTLNYTDYEPGTTIDWTFTLYNNSTDTEWLKNVYITFPAGIIVNSATNFTGGTADMLPDLTSGNGITIHWNGQTTEGWGVIQGGQSATAIVNVTILSSFAGDLILPYIIQGDIYGGEPHELNGQIVLSEIIPPVPWLSIEPVQGEIPAGGTAIINVTFSAQGIFTGVYNANLEITSNDPLHPLIILPVSMNVLQPNHPPVINLPESFSFYANESLVVDFTPYISDADNDTLIITCNGANNVIVAIEGSQVNFSATHNWFGTETITFNVFDGIDQSSDIVTINVLLNITTGVIVDSDNLPTTWTIDNSPFNITEPIVIDSTQNVTFEPGIVIQVWNDEPINILGSLSANDVTFAPGFPDLFWGGLAITGTAGTRTESNFINCEILNAINPISIINSSPIINTVYIAPIDTTAIINGTGITVIGVSCPAIDSVTILSYKTGIQVIRGEENLPTEPIINQIILRNSSVSPRQEENNTTGIVIAGKSNVIITDVDIKDYDTAVKIENTNPLQSANPSLSHIRIRNTSSTLRNEDKCGIELKGNENAILNDVQIEECTQSIKVENSETTAEATPSLDFIRIRNTSSTLRQELENIGILVEGNATPVLRDVQIENAETGIQINAGGNIDLKYSLILNCQTGLKNYSTELMPVTRNSFVIEEDEVPPDFLQNCVALSISAIPNLDFSNNTLFGYPKIAIISSSHLNLFNNIVWSNAALNNPLECVNGTYNVTYNDINYGTQVFPGTGNINANPNFVNASELDFALQYNSPCIDAGNPDTEPDPDNTIVDLGRFYYHHTVAFTAPEGPFFVGQPLQFINNSIGHNTPESYATWLLNGNPISNAYNLDTVINTWGSYNLQLVMTSGPLVDSSSVFPFEVIDETPLSPQNVILESTLDNYVLRWDAVTLSVSNTPITVSNYKIYASEEPYGTYTLYEIVPASSRQINLNLSELGSKRFFRITAEK